MNTFKVHFPTGYRIADIYNDNLDIYVIYEEKVYFTVIHTPLNLIDIMKNNDILYIYPVDTFIVRDLKKRTIRDAIRQSINDGYFFNLFSFVRKYSVQGRTIDDITEGETNIDWDEFLTPEPIDRFDELDDLE